mmetsp:Transcript_1532/g.2090  ORF Transcript_1532/g.2090 Transcript_1532/m.2090 type:complete len:350 (-) Transcript_1532:50-1099(-)|eukprot:CAMPEP_0178914710 /NCGR_PEP_ID=MMETSP0786-20121207/11590_1 /TAXON_ID=186022 /ORGANISM="Thalassionema frauenfeldii, Strain CCMP 1798" /LENGTH=349 /DNA_ID=CAMNT_0020587675 /DNA_START=11 /DNA_END=1060 /DNA_ORIENTATION=-
MKYLPILHTLLVKCLSGFLIPDAGLRHVGRLDAYSKKQTFSDVQTNRRFVLLGGLTLPFIASVPPAQGSVGKLPEFQDTNVVLKGVTVKVTEPSQLKQMISFLQICFDFKVLRSTADGSDVWMGYGPEQMSMPGDFKLPVSSFQNYGGHASIHIRYDPQATSPYYRNDGVMLGDNIAYIQVGVPTYRVSQMVKQGGTVLDAYGFVNVVTPCGVPMRGVVGVWPDPLMFCAINCVDVKKSKAFYEQLGFIEQDYPYCRLGKGTGDFEPPQPKNSVYLSPSEASMGILLIPSKKRDVTPNPAMGSLDLVYKPSEGKEEDDGATLQDLSGVKIGFESYSIFEETEKNSRIKQ